MIENGDYDRKGLEAIIGGLREELRTERAYSQQLREQSLRDLRELRAVRQALHDLQLKLTHPGLSQTRLSETRLARPTSATKDAGTKEVSVKS